MHVFIAGATGAVGRSLTTQLIEHGHTVTGTTRSPARADELRALGAEPVVVDGLDRAGMIDAVAAAAPDVVVHQMTALGGGIDLRRFAKSFEMTNRLRTEGTDNLLEAARRAGVERVVAQSYTGHQYLRTGGALKAEDDPKDPDPPAQLRSTIAAIGHVEQAVTGAGGVVLRYGGFYGPRSGMTPGGEQWEMIRARKVPIVGDGGGVWSFTHVEDAAGAVLAALDHWTPGEIYNIVDDDPAPVRVWLPEAARIVGAPPPRHIPRWVGRLMGEHVVVMMCELRGSSNGKAKERLGWQPRWPTWRDGIAALAQAERSQAAVAA